MKDGMVHKDNRVNEFRLLLEKRERWVGSGDLASCSGDEAPTTEAFFNVRGTWHFS